MDANDFDDDATVNFHEESHASADSLLEDPFLKQFNRLELEASTTPVKTAYTWTEVLVG